MSEMWVPAVGLGGGGIAAAFCAYKLLRPRFPVRVNCWFCNSDTVVPYGNRNCWDCPSCEQYNGFDKTGDYNKEIPSQYIEDLNHGVGCKQDEYLTGASQLCFACEQNQLLKVKQLANFIPMVEENYDAEIDAYKDYLEHVYELCEGCKVMVGRELKKQDDALRAKVERHRLDISSSSRISHTNEIDSSQFVPTIYSRTGDLLGVVSLICAGLIFVCNLCQGPGSWSEFWLLHLYIHLLQPIVRTLCYAGLVACHMSKVLIGKERLRLVDMLSCFLWILCSVVLSREIIFAMPQLDMPKWVISSIFAFNFLSSAISCAIKRERNTTTTLKFKRLSLDKSTGSHYSEAETLAVSSVSTSKRAYVDPDPVMPDVQDEPIDDLDLELINAFSIGPKSSQMKRSDSGMFSMAGSQSCFSSISAIPQSIQSRPRPLISPARFNIRKMPASTPTNSPVSKWATDSPNRTTQNLFLQSNLTQERLSLHNSVFNSQNSNQMNPSTESAVGSNVRPARPGSPFNMNPLWQHANFGQTHLSPDKLSQCKFSSKKAKSPPTFQAMFEGRERKTPVRKSLWQQQTNDLQFTQPCIDNNVFNRTPSCTNLPESQDNLFKLTSESLLGHKNSPKLKHRHISGAEGDEKLTPDKEDSSRSSTCPVDSTTISEPRKHNILKKFGLGVFITASVAVNAVLGMYYLYSRTQH